VSFLAYKGADDPQRPSYRNSTDQEVRDWGMKRLPQVFSDPVTRATHRGVHLDFLWGRAQLGLTYTLNKPHPSLGRLAVRKYWCCVHAPGEQKDVEVILTFFVYGGLRRLVALSPLFEYHLQMLEVSLDWRLGQEPNAGRGAGLRSTAGHLVADSGSSTDAPSVPLRQSYAVFDGIPPEESLGVVYRLRQAIKWLTGYW
jgi:hypothetical protein